VMIHSRATVKVFMSIRLTVSDLVSVIFDTLQEGLRCMSRPPRRYAHFLFAAMQSALTSSIAAAIASFDLIWAGGFLGHWLRSWAVAWILMLPVVIAAAPAILRLSELMTRPDAPNAGD
jgi:Protein of unknown function (DUF2798)